MLNPILLLILGIVFIMCGILGLTTVKEKNALDLFLFSAQIMIGICIIYFTK